MKRIQLSKLAVLALGLCRVQAFVPRTSHGKLTVPHASNKRNFKQSIYIVRPMSVEGDFDADAISRAKEQVDSGSIKARARALYKFTRPHTIRGTILASIAGTIRALIDTPGAISTAKWGVSLPRAFVGMIALLLGNAFIVGILSLIHI